MTWASCALRPRSAALLFTFRGALALVLTIYTSLTFAQAVSPDCDWTQGGMAPMDYRVDRRSFAAIERVHFPPHVEALTRGNTTNVIGADIDYMLGKVPNHHRALLSLVRLGEKEKSDTVKGTRGKVSCYFERAMRFRPDDTTVRLIYATFLQKSAREPEAIHQLELATEAAGDNPFTHYNIGLIYFDLQKFDRALSQAHKAYGMGFVQPQLRDLLKGAGKWSEPEEAK